MAERDIVEDLREGATVLDEWYHRESVAHTMLRAADEIERLRASTPEGSETQDRTMDGCDPARATYTRAISPPSHDVLREFAQEIADEPCAYSYPDGCPLGGTRKTGECLSCRARRALSQHVGGEG